MEIRHLRAFVEVVSEGHFGRAAARLNLTQPALSQRIHVLERELGVLLLERSAREVRLTHAGELLLPFAQNVVANEQAAIRDLRDLAAGSAGSIRIAYMNSSDVAVPGRIMAEFRHRHPAIEIYSSTGTSNMNLDRVASGDVDAAFAWTAGAGYSPAGVSSRWVGRLALVVALPSSHRLARLKRVPLSELAGERFVMYPREANPRLFDAHVELLERHMSKRPNIAAYDPPEQALHAVATSGSLITLLLGVAAERAQVPGVTYRDLFPSPMLDFGLAYRLGNPSQALGSLLKITEDLVGTQTPRLEHDQELLTDLD